jgi:hypothetical protein
VAVPLFLNLRALEYNRNVAALKIVCSDLYDSMIGELAGKVWTLPSECRRVSNGTRCFPATDRL